LDHPGKCPQKIIGVLMKKKLIFFIKIPFIFWGGREGEHFE